MEECWLLFENDEVGRIRMSIVQHDTIPSAHPIARILSVGCQSNTVASTLCEIDALGIISPWFIIALINQAMY
jgi:hypothetical protein